MTVKEESTGTELASLQSIIDTVPIKDVWRLINFYLECVAGMDVF